ncbi:MAG: hypothetical protein Q9169_004568 [Polycauliona sp. 2 TL-2023]
MSLAAAAFVIRVTVATITFTLRLSLMALAGLVDYFGAANMIHQLDGTIQRLAMTTTTYIVRLWGFSLVTAASLMERRDIGSFIDYLNSATRPLWMDMATFGMRLRRAAAASYSDSTVATKLYRINDLYDATSDFTIDLRAAMNTLHISYPTAEEVITLLKSAKYCLQALGPLSIVLSFCLVSVIHVYLLGTSERYRERHNSLIRSTHETIRVMILFLSTCVHKLHGAIGYLWFRPGPHLEPTEAQAREQASALGEVNVEQEGIKREAGGVVEAE